MKAEDLIQAMGEVDSKYIEEAALYRRSVSTMKIWRGIAIAACALLAASLLFSAVGRNQGSGGRSADGLVQSLYYSDTEPMTTAAETAAAKMYSMEAAEESMAYDYDMEITEDAVEYEVPQYLAGAASDNGSGAAIWNGTAGGEEVPAETAEPDRPAKIIYNIYMDMQTKDFDAAVTGIEEQIKAHAGYIENQYLTNHSSSYRSANYVIRIPADQLDAFVGQIGDLCAVTYFDRSANDVSESYYDTQSRLQTARTKLARLQELLAGAEDMEDIITIESAISDTEWQIDNYSGSLRYYDSHVNYSTVTINLREVYEVVVEEAPATFGDKISQSFQQGVRGFGNFLKNVVIWFVNSWIWLVILAVIVVVVVLLFRWHRRRKS